MAATAIAVLHLIRESQTKVAAGPNPLMAVNSFLWNIDDIRPELTSFWAKMLNGSVTVMFKRNGSPDK